MRPTYIKDATGARLHEGDLIRIVGVPELTNMPPSTRKDTSRLFSHLVGKYKRIRGFDEKGNVELVFRIKKGPLRGLHIVGIEPELVRLYRRSIR